MIDGMSSLAQVKAEATGCCRRRAAMRHRCSRLATAAAAFFPADYCRPDAICANN